MVHTRKTAKHRPLKIFLRSCATLTMSFALVLLFANSEKAKTVYEITSGDTTYTVESYSDEVSDALDEAGVELSDADVVEAQDNGDAVAVSITHKQYVTVTCDGATASVMTDEGDTTAAVLDKLNITLGENDICSKGLDETVSNGDAIVINRVSITYYDTEEAIPFSKKREASSSMARGTEAVTQKGVDGKTVYTWQQTSIDGGEPTTVLYNTQTTDPVTQITSYGTHVSSPSLSSLSVSKDYITDIDDEKDTITTVSGSTYKVAKTMTVSATAYTAKSGRHTSTGRLAKEGVIAVDPRVIPYGTKMYIVTSNGRVVYGTAVAGDCGSAIKGKIVDLFFDSYSECCSFGRRSCTVYILK